MIIIKTSKQIKSEKTAIAVAIGGVLLMEGITLVEFLKERKAVKKNNQVIKQRNEIWEQMNKAEENKDFEKAEKLRQQVKLMDAEIDGRHDALMMAGIVKKWPSDKRQTRLNKAVKRWIKKEK